MKDAYKALRYTTTMVVACIVATWLGIQLDALFDTSPLCVLLLVGYAISASLYALVKGLGGNMDE